MSEADQLAALLEALRRPLSGDTAKDVERLANLLITASRTPEWPRFALFVAGNLVLGQEEVSRLLDELANVLKQTKGTLKHHGADLRGATAILGIAIDEAEWQRDAPNRRSAKGGRRRGAKMAKEYFLSLATAPSYASQPATDVAASLLPKVREWSTAHGCWKLKDGPKDDPEKTLADWLRQHRKKQNANSTDDSV